MFLESQTNTSCMSVCRQWGSNEWCLCLQSAGLFLM